MIMILLLVACLCVNVILHSKVTKLEEIEYLTQKFMIVFRILFVINTLQNKYHTKHNK